MRTAQKKKFKKRGGLAQLGERLPYKQRVGGSSPSASTMNKRETDSNLINKAEPFFFIKSACVRLAHTLSDGASFSSFKI